MVESIWRECYRFTMPLRGTQFRTQSYDGGTNVVDAAGTLADSIFDPTGTDSVRALASGLFGGMMPANSQWVELVSDEPDEWLDEASKTVWKEIHASNFDQDGFDGVLDGVIAQGFLFIEDDEGVPHFECWNPYTVCCASSKQSGPVDIIYREFELTAAQAIDAYGDAVSQDIRACLTSSPQKTFKFLQSIYPNPDYKQGSRFGKQLRFQSCHIVMADQTIVRERGYHEFPVASFRWARPPGSVYAVGPVYDALPTIRSLNQAVSLMMDNAEIAVKGMWKAKDDGVINPATITLGGGRIVTVSDMDNFNPLNPPGDINIAVAEIEMLKADVRRLMMADYLNPPQNPMTRAEFLERLDIIRQMLGPAYGRVNEFLQSIVTRVLGILIRSGRIPPPPQELQQQGVTIRFTSPIARAQRLAEVNAIIGFEAQLAQLAQVDPAILDNYDWDEAQREKAYLMGVPQKLLKDKAQVRKSRAQREAKHNEAVEAQRQQELEVKAMPQMMKGA